MANLLQYYRTHDRAKLQSYYYICGSLRRGVELVVTDVRQRVKVQPLDFAGFTIGQDPFADFYDSLVLASKTRRLVQVRDAELLDQRQWERIFRWAARPASTILVLITNEDDPRKGRFPDYFRWFAKQGKFIECKQFTDDERILEFIQLYLKVTESIAEQILQRTGNDAERLLGELDKLRYAGMESARDLKDVLRPQPTGDLIDVLYRNDPRLNQLDLDEEFLSFLGLLELDLVRQAALIGLVRQHLPIYELSQRSNIPAFALKRVLKRSFDTNPQQLASRLDLIARTQQIVRLASTTTKIRAIQAWFLRSWKRV